MAAIIDVCATEHVTGPPTHSLIPAPVPATTTQDSSDYETSSSISTTSIEARSKIIKQRTCCEITWERFRRALKVKRKFIPAKTTYFFFYSARSVLATYFIVFLTTAGLDPEQAGMIQGIRMAMLTSGGLFWGLLADRSKKNALIMAIELLCFSAFMFAKPWAALWISTTETHSEHRDHVATAVSQILTEATNNSQKFQAIMSNKSNTELSTMFGLDWAPSHYNTGSTPLFVSMLGLGIASAFFGGGCQILLDSKVMDMVVSESRGNNHYGRQRLWGSLAYSVTPVICGVILESLPTSESSPLLPVFYIHLILITIALISCMVLFQQKVATEAPDTETNTLPNQSEQVQDSEKLGTFLLRTFKNPHMIMFFFNVFWMGMGNGCQWSFQFIYIQEMNATKTIMGVCVFVQCATEAVLFPLAPKINKRIGGNKAAITIGLLGYAVTFSFYSVIREPKWMTVVTTFIGVSYTLFYTAALDELYKASYPNCFTTMQALYNITFVGLGGLSGVIGGFVYKNYGGRVLYLSCGLSFLFMSIINIVYASIYKKSPLSAARNRASKTQRYKQFLDVYLPNEKSTSEINIVPVSTVSDDAISLVMDAKMF